MSRYILLQPMYAVQCARKLRVEAAVQQFLVPLDVTAHRTSSLG